MTYTKIPTKKKTRRWRRTARAFHDHTSRSLQISDCCHARRLAMSKVDGEAPILQRFKPPTVRLMGSVIPQAWLHADNQALLTVFKNTQRKVARALLFHMQHSSTNMSVIDGAVTLYETAHALDCRAFGGSRFSTASMTELLRQNGLQSLPDVLLRLIANYEAEDCRPAQLQSCLLPVDYLFSGQRRIAWLTLDNNSTKKARPTFLTSPPAEPGSTAVVSCANQARLRGTKYTLSTTKRLWWPVLDSATNRNPS